MNALRMLTIALVAITATQPATAGGLFRNLLIPDALNMSEAPPITTDCWPNAHVPEVHRLVFKLVNKLPVDLIEQEVAQAK